MRNRFVTTILTLLTLALSALALSACASVPLMTLPKLMSLDVKTIDLSEIEMAVRVQDNVGLKKGSAAVKVSLENSKLTETLSHSLILETPDETLTPYLTRQAKSGYKIHRFKMTPEQAIAAQAFREKALVMRSKGKKDIDMSLAARVLFCQYKDAKPYDAVSMKFYIRTHPKKDFYTLFKEQHIKFSPEAQKKMAEPSAYCT